MKNPSLTDSQKLGIASVLAGTLNKFETQNVCPNAVKERMATLGYESDKLDTNGWQYDWWLNFTKGDEKWTASGSGYYGTFEFQKAED